MDKYGSLLKDIDLERVGKKVAISTVFLTIVNKLVLALGIIVFLDYPFFTIATFNFNVLFYAGYIDWVRPFKEKSFHRQLMLN